MNMSTIISDMKLRLGIQTIALPFDKPAELVMKEILEGTIRTFSHYKKAEKTVVENINNLRYVNDHEKSLGIFFVPPALCTTEIHDVYATPVSSNYRRGETSINAFTVGSPFVGFGTYYPQDILNAVTTGAAVNKYAGVTSNPPTSEWLGYNKIRLYNFPSNVDASFVAKCDHELTGETIPKSQEEAFKKLAELDLKRALYENLKNMTNLGSAFKEIQLKIDGWAGADEAYNNMINEWNQVAHLDDVEDVIQFF